MGLDINALIPSSSSVDQSGSTTVSAPNQKILDMLTQYFGNQASATGGYTKDDAIKDSTGQIQDMITQMLQQNMPSISANQKTAGGYNDTTTQLMQNDLQARMDKSALSTVMQNIQNYATIQQNAGAVAATEAKSSGIYTNQNTQNSSPGGIASTFRAIFV